MTKRVKKSGWRSAVFALALSTIVLPIRAKAQDSEQQNDPPTRVARLGYIEGSVSFQPAGVEDWVQAVPNRPMTTGDRLWADRGSRAELQLGSAVIRLSENTGISFLNLDDHTVQIQLSSGTIDVRARRLDQDDYFEVDTPNLAFTLSQPGSYRLEASQDGAYTVVNLRNGGGQATGNGQTYTLHAGQRGTFDGTDSLNANVEDIGGLDQFDNWALARDRRYDDSPSARYLSHDVVGYEDLDDHGDWHDDANYGHVWFPHAEAGWAPYHSGHWDWIQPWGYTWVDDSSWGYAPFHYGRWVTVGGRWGWVAGPVEVRAVYAPALVVFIGGDGGGGGGGFGGNVAWFPLGPREVYVPPYHASRGYMNQVNVSNTTVNATTITNVYNTTIVNKSTTIVNVNYANRNVQGAVTAVPQQAFINAQPVARVAVAVNAQQIAGASVSARAAVAPTHQSVLGASASTANRVTAPPPAVMKREVVAKRPPPPPPVPFAKQQQALAANPGQSVPKTELQTLRPTGAAAAPPMVKLAPPGKPATPAVGHPGTPPNAAPPAKATTSPANQPPNQVAPLQHPATAAEPNRIPTAQPNHPTPPDNRPVQVSPQIAQPNRHDASRPMPAPETRPQTFPQSPANRPTPIPETRPQTLPQPPANRPMPVPETRPQTLPQPPANRPTPVPETRPQTLPQPPANRPETAPPGPSRLEPNRPPAAQPNRPTPAPEQKSPPPTQPQMIRPEPRPSVPEPRPIPQPPPAAVREPQHAPPPALRARPVAPPQQQKPQPPDQKKQEEDRKKREKPPDQ
jgi:hypothetical protein